MMAVSDPYAAYGEANGHVGAAAIDWVTLAPLIASALLKEPNKRMSKGSALRFGTNGSMSVNLDDGQFYDHENKVGGGMLDLIRHVRGCDAAGALSWLEDEGMKERTPLPEHKAGPMFPIVYDYRDEQGDILSKVKRTPDKRFVQLGPNGKGGFHAVSGCMSGVRRVPYRLPDLVAADISRAVFVVEGEKDADRLASLGLIATCNSEGAGKFRPELVEHFAGRKVVIIPDNDQAGRDHAQDVTTKLAGTADVVTVLALPGLRDKGDVSDWLDAGGTVTALKDLARAALADPPARPQAPPGDPLGPMCTVASMDGVELPDQQFLVDETLPVGATTTFFGNGGDGKTLCAMQMGVAVEQGDSVFGLASTKAKVLGFFCEDTKEELDRRFRSICRNAGIRQADVTGFEYQSRFGLQSLLGVFLPTGEFLPSLLFNAIRERAITIGARLIILDNIMHLYPGNVIDPGQVTRFLAALNRLALEIDGAVLLIGHTSKAEGSTFMGTMAWSNASRSRLFIGRPGDLDKKGDGQGALDDPDARIFARLKANYAPISAPMLIRWYQGSFTRAEDLAENVHAEIKLAVEANNANEAFLRCLSVRNAQKRHVSERPTAQNYAPKIFEQMPEAKRLSRKHLELAMDRLFRIGGIERGFLYRDTTEGKNIDGLRETSGNLPGNLPETRSGNIPESPRNHPETHPLYINISGAAPEAAAPSIYHVEPDEEDTAVTEFNEHRNPRF